MASHGHNHAEETPSYEDINTPVVILVGLISCLVTLLSMMFFQGVYYQWQGLREGTVVVDKDYVDPRDDQKKILLGGEGTDGRNQWKTETSIADGMQKVVNKFGK